jgi:hypothetical protein
MMNTMMDWMGIVTLLVIEKCRPGRDGAETVLAACLVVAPLRHPGTRHLRLLSAVKRTYRGAVLGTRSRPCFCSLRLPKPAV